MTFAKKIPYTVDCALTVTLQPKLFKHDPPMQYRETISALELLLKQYECKYVIVPELTPKNMNVHYHCLVKMPLTGHVNKKGVIYSIRNMFRNTKYFGYIDVKKTEDTSGWINYMMKEIKSTIVYLDLCPEYIDTKNEEINIYN